MAVKKFVECECKPRTPIPEAVKRKVRQDAGFGCCKCGRPIIEYHHIVKRSENPDEIMLLCPLCHYEATIDAMDINEQYYWKKNPKNIDKGIVIGGLKINQRIVLIKTGSCEFIGDGDLIKIDNEILLSLSLDNAKSYDNKPILAISIKLYDKDDNLLVNIEKNEWISGDPFPWDIESDLQKLVIRRKARDIALEISAKRYPIEIRADLWKTGLNIKLDPIKFIVDNEGYGKLHFENTCFVNGQFIINTRTCELIIGPKRNSPMSIIVGDKYLKRVRDGLKAWKIISKQ